MELKKKLDEISIKPCISRRLRRRLQPIFKQFANLINHKKYNDSLDET